MTQNQKIGQGALFKNDKQGNEKRPDYTGSATIYNKKFFISSWISTSQSGKKYMSLAFSEDQSGTPTSEQQNQTSTTVQEASTPADNNDIPF